MKIKSVLFSTVAAMSMVAAPAMATDGQIAGYLTKTEVDFGGGASDDGTGFGVKGWFGFGGPFAHFEYQSATLDDSDLDVTGLRVGGGMSGELNKQVVAFGKAEYVDFDMDSVGGIDGFGIHGGVMFMANPQVSFSGSLGYLMLSGDGADADGLEIDLNGQFKFNKQWGAFLGYRTWMGSFDGGGDIDINDLRAGVTFSLGR